MSADEESEEIPPPVKPHSLKRFVKKKTEMRAGSDAINLLQHQLEYLAEMLWIEASQNADDDGRKTVKEEDIQDAYDDLTEPHNLLKETADKLQWYANDLNRQLDQSIIYGGGEDGD